MRIKEGNTAKSYKHSVQEIWPIVAREIGAREGSRNTEKQGVEFMNRWNRKCSRNKLNFVECS